VPPHHRAVFSLPPAVLEQLRSEAKGCTGPVGNIDTHQAKEWDVRLEQAPVAFEGVAHSAPAELKVKAWSE